MKTERRAVVRREDQGLDVCIILQSADAQTHSVLSNHPDVFEAWADQVGLFAQERLRFASPELLKGEV